MKGQRNQGLSEKALINQKLRQLIYDYAKSDSDKDLVFSSDFTKDERKMMHMTANKLKLKTRSHGKGDDRYLVVSRKQDIWQTVEQLIECGGSNERYELIPPIE
ncbi:hypothetical protein L9F63_026112 [Diploptera punctata]|uniref:R3H domain-containing protein n=1 Tax=Diploptera punctata TaxID=6984 RepID=A0AAD8E2N0_DIPPU|nr:hypothetical protein L9F63_026112 [Diploptera punctata]